MQDPTPAVEMRGITKRFGALVALDNVSFTLGRGRIHGLLGENGAGKTTLMSVLYGLIRPDQGNMRVAGHNVALRNPRQALSAGLGMVHQHFMLAGPMSVLDNVLLGDRRVGTLIDRRAATQRLLELGQQVGLSVDPHARVETLSVGQQQRVEILKALWRDVRVLILDEPTAVLTPAEVDQLFAAVSRLRDQGRSVVFISHKLREVQRICDDLTVLRRGRVVWEGQTPSVTPAELARHMVGHDVAPVSLEHTAVGSAPARAAAPRAPPPTVLELHDVSASGLTNVSLRIEAGEILGIAGVDGNGQQELAEAIIGLRRLSAGRITMLNRDVTALPMADRRALGVAHIPNDRQVEGLVGAMSVSENLALAHHRQPPFSRHGVMNWREVRRVALDLAERFDINPPDPDAPVSSLSGGNQQKVLLARELAVTQPKLIVAMNPARGLDVAATGFVYTRLLDCRRAGAAILLISSDLDELLSLCDRIAVLYAGRLTLSDFPRTGAAQIGPMMTGVP